MKVDDVLKRLRQDVIRGDGGVDGRIPAERQLAARLGVSRGTLRRALAALEEEGVIWRGVGCGTFVRDRTSGCASDAGMVLDTTNPIEVMEARLVLEPELAGLAALKATLAHLDELDDAVRRGRKADGIETFERSDSAFHRVIARLSGNSLLLNMFDALNAARSGRLWGQLKARSLNSRLMAHYCDQHAAVVRAMRDRDRTGAAHAMRIHLQAVRQNFLES
jgi:DNA-binding FadR family transcriptional regulator